MGREKVVGIAVVDWSLTLDYFEIVRLEHDGPSGRKRVWVVNVEKPLWRRVVRDDLKPVEKVDVEMVDRPHDGETF